MTVVRWFERWKTEEGDPYVVSLFRCLVGVLLFLSALRDGWAVSRGPYFGDVFHIPLVPEELVPSRGVFVALIALQGVLAIAIAAGRGARAALLASALIGIYLLSCDRLGYHNNRYALLLFAFLLAFAPCDRAFVWGSRQMGAAAPAPLWAQRLLQLQLSIIYIASGGSKLLDADWRGGQVIGDSFLRSTPLAVAKGVPLELMHWLAQPWIASALSKTAIATELFLAVGLFLPRTRAFALWWGVMFHVTIEVTSNVELFGWLSVATYALFATPTTRERVLFYDPSSRFAALLAGFIRWFDWLARFELRPGGVSLGASPFAVEDRDGSIATGLLGVARLARATPILFPLSLPLLVLARWGRRNQDTRAPAC
jgi:hypothetical protein